MLHNAAYLAKAAPDADLFFLINTFHPVSFYGASGFEAKTHRPLEFV